MEDYVQVYNHCVYLSRKIKEQTSNMNTLSEIEHEGLKCWGIKRNKFLANFIISDFCFNYIRCIEFFSCFLTNTDTSKHFLSDTLEGYNKAIEYLNKNSGESHYLKRIPEYQSRNYLIMEQIKKLRNSCSHKRFLSARSKILGCKIIFPDRSSRMVDLIEVDEGYVLSERGGSIVSSDVEISYVSTFSNCEIFYNFSGNYYSFSVSEIDFSLNLLAFVVGLSDSSFGPMDAVQY